MAVKNTSTKPLHKKVNQKIKNMLIRTTEKKYTGKRNKECQRWRRGLYGLDT